MYRNPFFLHQTNLTSTAHSHTKAVAAQAQGLKKQPKRRKLLSAAVLVYVRLKLYIKRALGWVSN